MNKRILLMIAIISAVIGITIGTYFAISKGIPSIEELTEFKENVGTKIYADDNTLIGEIKVQKGIFVSIDKMPQHLISAVVSIEDTRFWKHSGIDYFAIARALLKDIAHIGIKEGGSTITQQLAKVVFLTPEKTLKRKIREASLAIKIEKNLSKKEILEIYLNRVYFGHGSYGVEMASKTYFGKSVKDLNLAESALIAALIKAPATYSPYNNMMRAKDRQETVLMRMEDEGYIKKDEREKAVKQTIYLSSLKRGMETHKYFIEYVKKYLEEKYDEDTIYKGGMKVYTTLNKNMQEAAQKSLQAGIRELDKRRGWKGPVDHKEDIDVEKEMKGNDIYGSLIMQGDDVISGLVLKVTDKEAVVKYRGLIGKLKVNDALWARVVIDKKTNKQTTIKNFTLQKILKPGDIVRVAVKNVKGKEISLTLEQEPEVEGAVVAMEQKTGFIRVIVGGYDYSKSEYNRAIYAKRQPGSAFKPIIYAAGMDNGFTPASIIEDEPVTYTGGEKGDWIPSNYDNKFNGPTRLRDGLAFSRNVVTVKLLDAIGIGKVIDFTRTLGYAGEIQRDLSIALGTISLTPLELTNMYSVFANSGNKPKPIAVKYIADSKGRVIDSNETENTQVISQQTAFLITSMMQDVVNYGTGWRIKALGKPVAGKTGTTNEYRDAWFVGYTTGLTTCVWVGFDDMKPLGGQETGARAASPIWLSFMKSAVSGASDAVEFKVPDGIEEYMIDPSNGLLAEEGSSGAIKEYFKAGTQPTQYSSFVRARERRETRNLDFD
jgi:penicillin-binding protein 1A